MNLIKINATDSTNDYLKALLKSTKLSDGTVVATELQTKGRGQMGATWYFERGKSLAFSIFKQGNGWPVEDQFYINFAVCVGVKKAFDRLGIPKTAIKWPNDILADGKKVCGILVESQYQKMQMTSSVIGIGINVNNTNLELYPQASSLWQSSGVRQSLDEVLQTVYTSVMESLVDLNHSNKEAAHQAYESFLFRRGEVSVFEDFRNNQFQGTITGVGPEGRLRVALEDGSLHMYQLKEIQLRY